MLHTTSKLSGVSFASRYANIAVYRQEDHVGVHACCQKPTSTLPRPSLIPSAELSFQFSRSSGPGGQHVNRTASQVELTFDVLHSPSLDEARRARVLSKLKSYIDTRGVRHLTSQTTRSQRRNRAEVIERFTLLLQRALHVPKRRIVPRSLYRVPCGSDHAVRRWQQQAP